MEGESDTLGCLMQQIREWIIGNEEVGVTEKAEEIKAGRYKHKERRDTQFFLKIGKGRGVR